MKSQNRNGNKWTINEVLLLQREFELCGLNVHQIAEKHDRTSSAIMFKLDQEGFTNEFRAILDEKMTSRSNKAVAREIDDVSDFTNHDSLSKRVEKMNIELGEIKHMLEVLTSNLVV